MEKLNIEQLASLKNKIKKQNEDKYLEDSKKRLENIIATKIRTTFIGAIDAFERTFGELWGKDESKLSLQQQTMLKLWQQVRTEILDLGNHQLRSAQLEIENHTIKWNRYSMNIPVKPRENRDEK